MSEQPDSKEVRLISYGWLSWQDAVGVVAKNVEKVTWLGTSKIERSDHLPEKMPVTTRLHGWSTSKTVLWRLVPRPASGHVLVTALVTDPNRHEAPTSEVVSARVTQSGGYNRWVVDGPSPVTFIAAA